MASVRDIERLLPQTQCGECDFSGCRPYAEALAQGSTTIDRCPPGGVETLKALGQLLHIDAMPYVEKVAANTRKPALAKIREAECIGCTKCIQACPVDAIIGSAKLMHSVLDHECTGCGLCVEPCPVDCIEMVPLKSIVYDKETAYARHQARSIRILKQAQEKEKAYRQKRKLAAQTAGVQDKQAKHDYIQQALARVQAKKTGHE